MMYNGRYLTAMLMLTTTVQAKCKLRTDEQRMNT